MRLSHTVGDASAVQRTEHFASWLLRVGNGDEPAISNDVSGEKNWIKIPSDLLIQSRGDPIASIVDATFPHFRSRYSDPQYLTERAVLAPKNCAVDLINQHIMALLPGNTEVFLSADSVSKSSDNIKDQDVLYPTEFLNSLKFQGIPNHELQLKVGVPIMLLRNLNPSKGLCNGTRLLLIRTGKFVLEAKILTGSHVGDIVLIPRIVLSPSETKWPFVLKRRQFPIKVSYAMTINKSQGQTLNYVGIYLKEPVFSHGQLYVALSRVTNSNGLKIMLEGDDTVHTKNVVYKEVYNNLPQMSK